VIAVVGVFVCLLTFRLTRVLVRFFCGCRRDWECCADRSWECFDEEFFGVFEVVAYACAGGSCVSASSEFLADGVDIDWGLSVPFGGFGA